MHYRAIITGRHPHPSVNGLSACAVKCPGPVTWNCETDAQIVFSQRQFRKSIGALQAKIQQSFNLTSPKIHWHQ